MKTAIVIFYLVVGLVSAPSANANIVDGCGAPMGLGQTVVHVVLWPISYPLSIGNNC